MPVYVGKLAWEKWWAIRYTHVHTWNKVNIRTSMRAHTNTYSKNRTCVCVCVRERDMMMILRALSFSVPISAQSYILHVTLYPTCTHVHTQIYNIMQAKQKLLGVQNHKRMWSIPLLLSVAISLQLVCHTAM